MKEEINIPIYRAKKIDSDEYVVGFYFCDTDCGVDVIKLLEDTNKDIVVDASTLTIHFPNKKDSLNNPIFASLNFNGKGADIVLNQQPKYNNHIVYLYSNDGVLSSRVVKYLDDVKYKQQEKDVEVVGIKQ